MRKNDFNVSEQACLILFVYPPSSHSSPSSPQLLKCREETDGRCPTRAVMKYLAKRPLLFEPGDRWEYSLCHDVLAALVEVISGGKFEDYVKRNIFDIVGMNNSTFILPESEIDTIAEQYIFKDGRAVNIGKHIPTFKIGSEYASGGAAGSYLAVDTKNEISIFFATHLHSSPVQGLRSLIYRFIIAEMFDNDEFENINKDLKGLYNYNLTY